MDEANLEPRTSSIFLLGFMASGKTTIGRALAAHLKSPFIDIDEEIIKCAGKPIAEIIRQEGEPYFRQLETQCLQQATQERSGVIALGGGAFLQAINRDLIAQKGISVWLNAPFELCWRRIQQDTVVRPLAPTKEEAYTRYQQRTPIYQQSLIHVPVTEEASLESVVAQILSQLGVK